MTVLFDAHDGVATVTLHRPEVRNAFGAGMGEALADAYRRCDEDDAIRAIVLTGTPPAFCVGADMRAAGETFAAPDPSTFSAAAVPMPAWQVRKPVIAAVNGHAIGIGFTLTLQCDLRIFAADARYGIVQVRRGVMGDGYSHWTLPRTVGMARAADLLLTGRTFDGNEALQLGVCNRVLANDEVLPAALELAHDIAVNTAPLSVAYSKALLWESWDLDPAGVEARETEYHHHLMGAPDAREGVLAFLEGRAPKWSGRVSAEWRGPTR
ncbi:MAG TPA: enoyl-CoA hydratase-related protein [Acidimicrobiia bacterium]|nr:enoyl-CoA hydratase-related protein [Acidimicrobiia bacterium]